MATTNVFSLRTVTVVIENDSIGTVTIYGGDKNLLGSVGYSYTNEMYTMDSTPDGGYVANFNSSRAGTITLVIKQSSLKIGELTEFINQCFDPSQASSTITITDTQNNIVLTANDVFPKKIPDNTVGASAENRSFEFVAGEIYSGERQG